MAQNYARGPSMGNNQVPFTTEAPPAVKAVKQYVSENGTASSVVTLTQDTTAVEIATGGAPAVMRWVTTADTQASVVAIAGSTANLDHTIPANAMRRFIVPIESPPNQGYSSMQGINRSQGLFQRLAYKTQGIASVLVTEYGSSNSY